MRSALRALSAPRAVQLARRAASTLRAAASFAPRAAPRVVGVLRDGGTLLIELSDDAASGASPVIAASTRVLWAFAAEHVAPTTQRALTALEAAETPPLVAAYAADGALACEWGDARAPGGSTTTRTSAAALLARRPAAAAAAPAPRLAPLAPLRTFPAADVLKGAAAHADFLRAIADDGLVVVRGAPACDEGTATALARALAGACGDGAPLRTMYGETWTVRAEAAPRNAAFTSAALELHQDLVYCESPPGVQVLVCAARAAEGGASLFVDAFAAAEELWATAPWAFATLARVPTTWHKATTYARLALTRTAFHVTPRGALVEVRWAPPFEAPPRGIAAADVDAYFAAYAAFARLLDDVCQRRRPGLVEVLLAPGEAAVFSNRRMLHGRAAFRDAACGGGRLLVGAYAASDAFREALAWLDPPHTAARLGCGDEAAGE